MQILRNLAKAEAANQLLKGDTLLWHNYDTANGTKGTQSYVTEQQSKSSEHKVGWNTGVVCFST
jgi:hypothetical protein